MNIKNKAHYILIFYCILIFVLSSIPGDNFPSVDFEFSDKIVHVIIYSILFILFFYSLKNQRKNVNLQKYALEFSLLFTALYGLSDELHQYFVPNRSCDFYDWVADASAGLIVYIIFKLLYYRKKNIVVTCLAFFLLGCSGSEKIGESEKINVSVSQQEVWLDLMPTVGSPKQKNIFDFLITIGLEGGSLDNSLRIRDFKIYLNNDTLNNKNFNTEYIDVNPSFKKINIMHDRNVLYLDTNKPLPENAKFIFNIYQKTKKLKHIETSYLKIERAE